MYIYIAMRRTQIYLTDALDLALSRLSKQTGRTRSQLIRMALEQVYLGGRAGMGAAEPRAAHGASDDVPTWEVTAAAAGGGAFDFWAGEEEDVYVPTDGEPLE